MKPKPKSKTKTPVFPWERPKTVAKKVEPVKKPVAKKKVAKKKAVKPKVVKPWDREYDPYADKLPPAQLSVTVQEDNAKLSPFVKTPPEAPPLPPAPVVPPDKWALDPAGRMIKNGKLWIKAHPGCEVRVSFKTDDRDFLFVGIKKAVENGLVSANDAGYELMGALVEGLEEPRAIDVQEVMEGLLIKKLE